MHTKHRAHGEPKPSEYGALREYRDRFATRFGASLTSTEQAARRSCTRNIGFLDRFKTSGSLLKLPQAP